MKPVAILLLLTALLSGAAVRPRSSLAQTEPGPFREDLMPPLLRAAVEGRSDEVRKLLQSGADVNQKLDGLGITALMLAAGRGDLELVKLLLQAGADPNAAGGVAHVGFFTPLTMALNRANKNRLEVIDALIAGGALLNPPASFPESPLDRAIAENDIEMVRALLKRGSDVNWEDAIGHTPLVTAISIGERNVEVIKLLLAAGADPNKPRLLAGYDCVSILQTLVERQRHSPDRVTKEITRLIVKAGGRKRIKKSLGEQCKPW